MGTKILNKQQDPDYDENRNKYLYEYEYGVEPNNGLSWVMDQTCTAEEAIVTGNSTFALMQSDDERVLAYSQTMGSEYFYPQAADIEPTTAFLLATPPANEEGMPVMSISRTGKINYGKGNTPSGTQNGNVPTISGGSDIFVTEIANGINIAVVSPQYVRVLSSAGALLYNGMVETSVDVNLPNNGIYVVAGENNSIKIMY